MTRTVAVALGSLALWPAAGAGQTPVTPEVPTAGSTSDATPKLLDRTKVVPATDRDPLDLLQNPGDEIKLSDEKLVTRWGHAQASAKIFLSPLARSRTTGRLRFFTEDGLPEVYLVLAARRDAAGRNWLRVRVPRRPNGTVG